MQDESKQGQITVNHMLMFVLDPDLFGGGEQFRAEVEVMQQYARSSRPARASIMSVFLVILSERPWRIVCGTVFPSTMDR